MRIRWKTMPTPGSSNFGKRLATWRASQSPAISQTQLAQLLGISRVALSNWEARGSAPSALLSKRMQALIEGGIRGLRSHRKHEVDRDINTALETLETAVGVAGVGEVAV